MKLLTPLLVIVVLTMTLLLLVSTSSSVSAHEGDTPRCIAGDPSFSAEVEADLKREPRPLNIPGGFPSLEEYIQNRNAGSNNWAPIRISVSTLDLFNSNQYCSAAGQTRPTFQGTTRMVCGSSHVLSTEKRDRLIRVVNEVVDFFKITLSVESLANPLLVGSTTQCSGGFSIPSSHTSSGVANADFVLYVAAGPASSGLFAFAGGCQLGTGRDNPRIVVGRMNVNPTYLDAASERALKLTVTHELMHALGYIKSRFDQSNLLQLQTFRGRSKNAIISPRALMTARNFFDCQTLQGVELEDEAGTGTIDNHLDARVFKTDLMAGIDGLYLSTIDLAIMEDLGVYRANYSNTRPISFGNSMGCSFLTENCNSAAGGFGKYWCSTSDTGNGCTADFRGYGGCYASPELTDGCSFYLNNARRCYELQGGLSNTTGNGESFSEEARCFMTDNSFKLTGDSTSVTARSPRCFDIKCETNGSLFFRVGAQTTWNECSSAGENITVAGYDGLVTCPFSLVDVCRTLNETGDLNDVPSVTLWTVYPKPSSNAASGLSSFVSFVLLSVVFTLLV